METLRWELHVGTRGRGSRVSHPEEGAGSVSQSGSFLCSSVGGAGGARVTEESRADGSCGEGGKRSVGLCGPEGDRESYAVWVGVERASKDPRLGMAFWSEVVK
jgi:hypothetical protein